MNRKILIPIVIIILAFVAFWGYAKRESDSDRIFANLISKMKEGKYKDIYENSSDFLHLNADEEKFTERMKDALEKMKKADGDLNFERNREGESILKNMERETDKAVGRETPNNRILVIQQLGEGDNKVTVLLFWEHRGLFPKFNDLAVIPTNNERQDLRVKGIAYKN